MTFADPGMQLEEGCGVYVVSAQIILPLSGETFVARCAPAAALEALILVECSARPRSTQTRNDLIFSNQIDLNALGDGFSCLGIKEYTAQVRNRPGSGVNYDVTIDAKYICSTSTTTPNFCPVVGNPPGPGENQGTTSFAQLPPGQCITLGFLNDDGVLTLPRCCDDFGGIGIVAVQCGSFSVTGVGADTCAPAFFSPEEISQDGGTITFGCNFDPLNESTAQETF